MEWPFAKFRRGRDVAAPGHAAGVRTAAMNRSVKGPRRSPPQERPVHGIAEIGADGAKRATRSPPGGAAPRGAAKTGSSLAEDPAERFPQHR